MSQQTPRKDGFVLDKINVWRRFTVSVTLVIALFVLGIFIGVFMRNREVMREEVAARARSHFHNILIMREWNAGYGGVYVEKKPGVESNPYLENPDITGADGTAYTKKNPALMTREVSTLADKHGLFTFHITSLRPLNPGNAADDFEKAALSSFESGTKEVMSTEQEGGKTYFRYMAPLFAEKPCLSCHAKQGYQGGEVRGGISVKFDVSALEEAQAQLGKIIVALCAATLALLLGTLYFFIYKLMRKLRDAQSRLEEMALTDALTGLFNRRYLFERLDAEFARAKRYRAPLSCIMVDVDHFKRINDTFGHQTGDEVLKGVADILKSFTRVSDVAARFGGEEFLLLLPGTDLEGARLTAEKLRCQLAEQEFFSDKGGKVCVTASFGCSAMALDADDGVEAFVRRADESLYTAKASGRNQVCCKLMACKE
jgi:diguanylate cyclase (GGDEF)-like protein